MSGFFDRAAKHGPVSGHGPNYEKAVSLFNQRQAQANKVGIWRRRASFKHDDGTFIDPDFMIFDYGQNS